MATPTSVSDSSSNWQSPFEHLFGATGPVGSDNQAPAIHEAPHQFGTPGTDTAFWDGQQSYSDTCAIRCQEFILEQFSGQEISEDALVQQAIQQGWYRPGNGTQMQDVGNLLELNGVPVTRYEDATVFNLSSELAQGHKVIVGVDSGELWHRNSLLDTISDKLGISGADHAVIISGIDTSDPNHIQVIISDPGTGDATASYPLEQFVDAWQDSGFYMVATQNAAPPEAPGMANFDYAQGHIDQVWGLDYDEFMGLADQPHVWSNYLERALGASDTAGDDFHATADKEPATETDSQSFLTGETPFQNTLLGLVDDFVQACHFDHGNDYLQPDSSHGTDYGESDFDGSNV